MSTVSPRWLDRDALADYIGERVDRLPRLQKAGKLPRPTYHLGPRSPRWDRETVDSMLAGEAQSSNVRSVISELAQEIAGGANR